MLDLFMIFCLGSWSLAGVFGVEVKPVLATEGDSVSLHMGVTKEQITDVIEWRFGNILLAKLNRKNNTSTFFNTNAYGRFVGRLKLDNQTGSLTITNSKTTDSGLYNVTSEHGNSVFTFTCTVYGRLPVPDILFNFSQCSSSSSSSVQNCSVVCSVENVSAVSLSWYKGNSLLSSINVSDLSISLSLPLEVECQDKNTYSCVINNTISNQTTHLDINTHCQPCEDSTGPVHLNLIVPLSAAAGCLILALLMILCICMKHKNTDQKVETRAEEITYADPTFYKRKAPKLGVQEEPDVVYAGVAVRP
ncbi:uncharacterized protein [Danio rerio]|uniref:Uncharacterized protein n=1 Tax=Danio rerio TaxID=7955 RepID=A0AC58IGG9_DANRE